MKVFVSSLISGFEQVRATTRSAIETLRHAPVMAEDFGARPDSPQIACLQGVREADLVVLILGSRYGTVQGTSGLSPTHEEYREAQKTKPVLAFVQQRVTPEPAQSAFIEEVQAWQGGLFRAGFSSPEELRDLVIRGVHDYQLANAAGPLDLEALRRTAVGLLPETRRNHHTGTATLNVAIAGGPMQPILRPAQLEAPALRDKIHQQALFGATRLFDPTKGVLPSTGDVLSLEQEDGAGIQLDEHGALLLRLSVQQPRGEGFAVIIEETVSQKLLSALAFTDWLLETIDPTQKLSHLALAVSVTAGGFTGWRTVAEHAASPNRISVGLGNEEQRPPVHGDYRRPALRLDANQIAEDLVVRLRRQWKIR